MSQASLFIGVDSGPMHIARAFGVRSLIVTDGSSPADIFARRKRGPYYLYGNHVRAFLYEDLEHLYVPELTPESLVSRMGEFVTHPLYQK
jgi:ADP-heptose:LPS heptosyltransferase